VSLTTDLSAAIARDARLAILNELAKQVDGRLNDQAMTHVLDVIGVRRSRDWVRTQIRALAELDAVRLIEAGELLVAELTSTGRDHVERRIIIEGVARPRDA
jgi:ribosomal protein L12E/L44/L45/RPP1/RPP2